MIAESRCVGPKHLDLILSAMSSNMRFFQGGSMISKMATSASLLGLKESTFMSRSRKLGLIQSEKDKRTRTHSAGYVFNDLYVPLVAKLLESINQGNLDQLSKILGESTL